MSGFSATHFHLISTSELQKPSCNLHLVRKEELAEFLSIISRLVPSWTPPCASLAAKLPCDAPLSTHSHRWRTLTGKSLGLLLKGCVVCEQHKGKARCHGEQTTSTLTSKCFLPSGRKSYQEVFYFSFSFQAVYYH